MTDDKGSQDPSKIDNSNATGTGTDPNKTDKTGSENVQDSQGGEKAFDEKVFDDPRLWTHPRFKSLNEKAKLADKLEKEKQAAEEKRLVEEKKFEELATKAAQERDEVKSKYTSQLQDNRIITEASKIGVVDIETVLKLVDRSAISVDEATGNVTGVAEALQALVTAKPFLKGKPGTQTIGSPTNPGADTDTGAKKFKLSQIQDPAFYREHEKDILQAYKNGLVEDDMTPTK